MVDVVHGREDLTASVLKTGSKYDKDFVAAYEHVQIRHTRHPRRVRIVTQE